uniref:RRM domain-containing protein n=1 Tax=Panagrellus redivivus TaxID=6233 RepID=A0A7E4WCQ2_PANRE
MDSFATSSTSGNENAFENALAALREKMTTCNLDISASTSGNIAENENETDFKLDPRFVELEKDTEKRHELDDLIGSLSPIKSTERLTVEDKREQIGRTVYVSNLPDATTSEDLSAFFEPCGPIERINLVTNSLTGEIDGFAYIKFIDREGFETALKFNKATFLGNIITVEPKENASKNFGKSPRFLTRYRNHLRKTRGRLSRTPY